jgi:hypothetical protein
MFAEEEWRRVRLDGQDIEEYLASVVIRSEVSYALPGQLVLAIDLYPDKTLSDVANLRVRRCQSVIDSFSKFSPRYRLTSNG